MVAPKRRQHAPLWLSSCLRIVFLVTLFVLVLVFRQQQQHDDEQIRLSSSGLELEKAKSPHEGKSSSSSGFPPLDCQIYLDQIRNGNLNVADPNESKVFAAFMTNYNPPFWISNPVDDRETFRAGTYLDDQNHLQRLQEILDIPASTNTSTSPQHQVVWFVQPNDWGWFPLWAASQGHVVTILHPSNATNTMRICEAARLNQWTKEKIRIYNAPTLPEIAQEWMQGSSQTTIRLLQIQGNLELSSSTRQLLESERVEFIWSKCEKNTTNAKELIEFITQLYQPFWPVKNLADENTKVVPCSIWWKRR